MGYVVASLLGSSPLNALGVRPAFRAARPNRRPQLSRAGARFFACRGKSRWVMSGVSNLPTNPPGVLSEPSEAPTSGGSSLLGSRFHCVLPVVGTGVAAERCRNQALHGLGTVFTRSCDRIHRGDDLLVHMQTNRLLARARARGRTADAGGNGLSVPASICGSCFHLHFYTSICF